MFVIFVILVVLAVLPPNQKGREGRLAIKEIQEGATGIRKIFRKRSLVVHPDKVAESRAQATTAMFAKVEAAWIGVQTFLTICVDQPID